MRFSTLLLLKPTATLLMFGVTKRIWKIVRKRFLHRARICFRYSFRASDKRPIFVISTRRSGSNLLISYLNSIAGVAMQDEILHPSMYYGLRSRWISKRAVIRHVRHSLYFSDEPVTGAKFHMRDMDAHGLKLDDLARAFPAARFIVLYRRSLSEQLVSLRKAEKTDTWVSYENNTRPVIKIRLGVGEILEYETKIRRFYEFVEAASVEPSRRLWLTYEELAQDPQRTFHERILPFLELPPRKVSTNMKRLSRFPFSQVVENYEEVRSWLEGNRCLQSYGFAESAPERAGEIGCRAER